MKPKHTFWLLLAAVLALPTVALAQDDAPQGPTPTDDGVAVTIYNQGQAIVQDRRTLSIREGQNVIDFTDVAAQIDPTSVSFASLTAPESTTVLEQNYVYDLVGADALYRRYIDQEIRLVLSDGTELTGVLQSADGGNVIVQRERDGSVILVSQSSVRDVTFPSLPEGLITRPTLRWTVQSETGGDQQVAITYLTGGMNWTADYNLLLSSDNAQLDLNGWVTLNNTSGSSYDNALVKLVAGDVNRLPQPQQAVQREEMAFAAAADAEQAGATQREFYEYQLYEINRRVTVGNNETKQVEFVSGADVPATTYYVYDASPGYQGFPQRDPQYGQTGVTDVQNYLEFDTGEENGLGADLPAGRVRVYQEDIDGAALLIGENRIDHTPQGEVIDIYLGNAFDLVGERTQTNFNRIANNVVEETYEIRLRNRKDEETVEIRVPETLYRWNNWEIIQSTDEFEQVNSNNIEFRVDVEPDEERVIEYTVRYTFPN